MANFLTYYRNHHQNLYALIISVLLSLWYNGLTGIFNYYFPNRGPALSLIFLIIPLAIFLGDDNKLDELYKVGDANPVTNITAASNSSQQKETYEYYGHKNSK
ncbi:hypothetical protein Indivirus_6_9 [Indivirus ILV1]|uniref:Uncharacterized protein n=1 Tax=Indivirus ILV1 TaxID=1977633 RepID=A0A1V0SE03_9VIRU|nr:hypothetical protein Indivirus_6_9 [Indivirus ILV1]